VNIVDFTFLVFHLVCCEKDLLVPIFHRVLLTGNQMLFSAMASSNQPWGHLNYTPKEIVKQSASDFYCRHWGERQKSKGLHPKTHLQNPAPAYMLDVHSICLIAKTMEATTWIEFRFAVLFLVVKWNVLLLQDAPWTQSLCSNMSDRPQLLLM
jgi:hypothetical protein